MVSTTGCLLKEIFAPLAGALGRPPTSDTPPGAAGDRAHPIAVIEASAAVDAINTVVTQRNLAIVGQFLTRVQLCVPEQLVSVLSPALSPIHSSPSNVPLIDEAPTTPPATVAGCEKSVREVTGLVPTDKGFP